MDIINKNSLGAPNVFLIQISQNIDGFRQTNRIHNAFRIHKQNPLEIFFLHNLPKLYFGKKKAWGGGGLNFFSSNFSKY